MERNASLNEHGLTLIEVLVATVVMLIAFLGMMEGARVSMGYAMKNATREMGVRLAEDNVAEAKATPVTQLAAGTVVDNNVVRKVKLLDVRYAVTRTITTPNPDTRRVEVTVAWPGSGAGAATESTSLVTLVTTKGMTL